MDILGVVTSILGGGVTGLAGTVIQNVYSYKSKKLDIELEKTRHANELEQRRLDAEVMKQEWAARTQIAEVTAQGEVDKADAESFAKSYELEPERYSNPSMLTCAQNWLLVLLDVLRAVIRPGLCIYLSVLTTLIYLQTRALIPLNQAGSFDLLEKLVGTILYLFTTIVLWYYGSRAAKPK